MLGVLEVVAAVRTQSVLLLVATNNNNNNNRRLGGLVATNDQI